ncbi:MAG: AAA family ATPase [Planctomycetia bacterium]|nr:AAA family ATPase [Planctomycetia bacterium]
MSNYEELRAFMLSKGIPIHDENIYIDGKVHRYSTRNDSEKAEWYIGDYIEDKKIVVTFSTYKNGNEEKFTYKSYKKGEVENEEHKITEFRKEQEMKLQKLSADRLKEFQHYWKTLTPCLNHPYLEKKKIKPKNLLVKNEILHIPLYNKDLEISSCIRINKEGVKRYFHGLSAKLLFTFLGNIKEARELIFCEGYATGYTIHFITGLTVIACGSCNNVCMVAQVFNCLYPDKTLSVAIDNDKAGLKVAQDWKDYFNESIYISKDANTDFNDLYCKYGEEAIKDIFIPYIKGTGLLEMSLKEVKEEECYNKILNVGSINVLHASAKVGKSRFAYEMAVNISLNQSFLNFKTYKQGHVLYIDGELSDSEIHKRINDIKRRLKKAKPILDFRNDVFKFVRYMDFKESLDEKMNLINPKHQKALHPLIMRSDIIIIDSYDCVTVKREGESYKFDQLDWRKFFWWIRDYKEKFNKTFLLIMHETKYGNMAGSQFIKNDCDNFYQLISPTDIDRTAAAHFKFKYKECRTIPLDEQEILDIKLYPNNPLKEGTCGWEYTIC